MRLLFDLDGTITDSAEGIVRCIQHALGQMGRVAPPAQELTRYVGPPIAGSFATLLGTADAILIDRAIAAFRHRFERVGIFENAVYPGMKEALTELTVAGHDLCVVTAKPHVYARRVLEHFAIARLFRDIYAPELWHRTYTKESLIREACDSRQAAGCRRVMVGDRAEDILGAKRNGLGSIGVTWGYGERAELEAAQPDHLVSASEELVAYIRRVT